MTDNSNTTDNNNDPREAAQEPSPPDITQRPYMKQAKDDFGETILYFLGIKLRPIPDGKLHFCEDSGGKKGNEDGWYIFHEDGIRGCCGSLNSRGRPRWHYKDNRDYTTEEMDSALRRAQANTAVTQVEQPETSNSTETAPTPSEPETSKPAKKPRGSKKDKAGKKAKLKKRKAEKKIKSEKPAKGTTAGDKIYSPVGNVTVTPLVDSLPPVKPLTEEMLPKGIASFVTDTAARLQIAPDFVAVAALAIVAGVVGSKVGIHPMQQDDWLVFPIIWGGLISPPSMKKTSLSEAKRPLTALEEEMARAYKLALESHAIDKELAEANRKQVMKEAAKLSSTEPQKARDMVLAAGFHEEAPNRQRYLINDATVEKCGEIMSQNPNGLLLVRDELSGWIARQSREEHQDERAFYLECFDGNSRFTYDRIGRGTIEIESCTLSICGGIQPSKIAPIVRAAVDGSADDGLIQRFQLGVWPDKQPGWKWTDRKPNKDAYQQYEKTIRALHELHGPGGEKHIGNLRFTVEAQDLFRVWMEKLHKDIDQDDLHPVMQAHLLKMPKTIASLALLFELIDGGRSAVGVPATEKAISWADYLISHATRMYSGVTSMEVTGAKLILSRREKLPDGFTARDIKHKNWTGLSAPRAVEDALQCLVDHGHLQVIPHVKKDIGGRTTTKYRWNPYLDKKS